MSTEDEKLLKEVQKLSWDERLQHKNGKMWNDANIDLTSLRDSITDHKDTHLREFGPLFKKTVADSKAPVQEKALDIPLTDDPTWIYPWKAGIMADLPDYDENKLKNREDELVLKVKTAIEEVEAGGDEYSLLVNLKRLYELQLSKLVKNDGLLEDMYQILNHLRDMDNEVKSFLLLNMYLQVACCLYAIDGENPSKTFIDEFLSKQSSLFEQLYYFLVVLPTYQKEGRSTTVLSCRVGIITAEMCCLFKKSKYYSTRLESLSYLPQLDVVQKFWKLCEQQLNISDETEDEDANEEYIEDINRDAVMISAAKLVLADTVSKDYFGPEIVSHYVSHGASTAEIIKHLITTLRKNSNINMAVLFFEAFRRQPRHCSGSGTTRKHGG